jgi:hypothetical protein
LEEFDNAALPVDLLRQVINQRFRMLEDRVRLLERELAVEKAMGHKSKQRQQQLQQAKKQKEQQRKHQQAQQRQQQQSLVQSSVQSKEGRREEAGKEEISLGQPQQQPPSPELQPQPATAGLDGSDVGGKGLVEDGGAEK